MGKQHSCIAWVPILWDKCCNLFSKKSKDCCVQAAKYRDLSSTKNKTEDSVKEIEEDFVVNPNLPADIITNTLDRRPFLELPEIIRAIEKSRPIPHLPSDIISNILSRLPAKSIFQIWQQTNPNGLLYHLTTDPYFTRTHLDRCPATPTIVAHSTFRSIDDNIKLFFFDGSSCNGYFKNIEEAASLDLRSWNCKRRIFICGSYDGFLLFNTMWDPAIFCIWNPITKEQVIVTSPPCPIPERTPTGWPSPHNRETWVCGFYFHPHKKEYEVICVRMLAGTKMWEFQILNLRTRQRRSVGSCSYPPSRQRCMPVIINGTFYWMVDRAVYFAEKNVYPSLSNSILSFSLETEEFSTMDKPYIDSPVDRRFHEKEFQLFDLDGELGLFDPSSSTDPEMAAMWVFNYRTKRWDKKHSMTSSAVCKHWEYFREIDYIKMKGEFVAYPWCNIRNEWYVYNLRLGTWKVFKWKMFECDQYTTAVHTHSVISLDAAGSVIPIQWERST